MAVDATKIDLVKAAGDGVEAGGENDDIELEFPLAGFDPFGVMRSIGVTVMSTSSTFGRL